MFLGVILALLQRTHYGGVAATYSHEWTNVVLSGWL